MAPGLCSYTFDDAAKWAATGKGCCFSAASCCFAFWFILFVPVSIVQLGQKKYGLSRNKLNGVVDLSMTYRPGRYWHGFWKEFILFPSTLNTIEFSDERPEVGVLHQNVLRTRDQDGKRINLDLSLQYKLIPEKVGDLYGEMMLYYEDIYIAALRDILAKVGNTFAVHEMWENYEAISNTMKQKCVEVLAARHAECWDLQIWRVRLESSYESKLVATQVRKQAQRTQEAHKNAALVRAETEVVLAEYRRNKTVVEAGGEAQRYAIERAAEANASAARGQVQADIIGQVRDVVKVGAHDLNSSEIVAYQRLVMLSRHSSAHFVYSGGGVQSLDVRSASELLSAASRRLQVRGAASEPAVPLSLGQHEL
mmetsp:Transcript_5124/g.15301  ORF Transcript_5124/g.15301 Transcript_5124/m.15301 type:complete len:367 (-) Transcript_5124:63-1163(-)